MFNFFKKQKKQKNQVRFTIPSHDFDNNVTLDTSVSYVLGQIITVEYVNVFYSLVVKNIIAELTSISDKQIYECEII